MNKKTGFSLAETLTVLTIIGVISAFLIPSLNANLENLYKIRYNLKKLKLFYLAASL